MTVDSGHVTESQWLRAVMRDAQRLVGVSHVNICPVVAACFDHVVTGDPVWLVYNASSSSVYLKILLDQSRRHGNVRCSGGLPIRQSRQLPQGRHGVGARNFSEKKNIDTYRLNENIHYPSTRDFL